MVDGPAITELGRSRLIRRWSAVGRSTDMFDLNLRHLAALPTIIRLRGIAAAAVAMGISQPALTQGVHNLEAQLGVRLFERHAAGTSPTPAGVLLAAGVERTLDHLHRGFHGLAGAGARPEMAVTMVQLRSLLSLADHGGFALAARALDLAEGTVHRAVRTLERQLAMSLVVRRGRRVALTDHGRLLAGAIRLMAREMEAAIIALVGADSRNEAVAIGAMPLCRAQLLPRALQHMLDERPDLGIRIVEGSWKELVELLRDGTLDMMIGALRENPAPQDLDQRMLFEDRLVIVAGAGHPLQDVSAPSVGQLSAFRWIVGPVGSPLRAQWERLFGDHALPAAPIECGSVSMIRGLLRSSDLLTLLSPAQVAADLSDGTLSIIGRQSGLSGRRIGAVMRAGFHPTPVQSALLDALNKSSGQLGL